MVTIHREKLFDIVCTVHHIVMCIKADQLDAQILVMCLYLSLDALHVSDYISPSSGATL